MWRDALIALLAGKSAVWASECVQLGEDCSHLGTCCDSNRQCYKKNDYWAACLLDCQPGMTIPTTPIQFRTPWECILVTPETPDCAEQGENCAHLGCCKDAGFKCHQKNLGWAQCLQSCEPQPSDSDWTCKVIHPDVGSPLPPPDAAPPAPASAPATAPDTASAGSSAPVFLPYSDLTGTHFWDCNGGSCDAGVLQPWDGREYKYAPHYAPVDPSKHGGAKYGEKLWMTGAASHDVADMLGPDTEFCGSDAKGGGGCGKCLLVRTDDAVNKDWTVVIMKKNLCPDHGGVCSHKHYDFAVPGFDNIQYSTANICGSSTKSETYLTKEQSGVCSRAPPSLCDCNGLPGNTPEQRFMREGCELFKAWGWTHGDPKFHYKLVACPENFVEWIQVGSAFGAGGVMAMYDNSTTLAVLGDSDSAGQKESGQQQWMLVRFASPLVLVGAILFAGLRVRSCQTPSVDSEELLELQPSQ